MPCLLECIWRGNGDRIHRRNSIRDAIFSAAQTTALALRKELPSLVPCSQSCPADISLPIWERGRPAVLDVSVISTLQQLTLSGAASVQGHTLRVGGEEDGPARCLIRCCGSVVHPSLGRVSQRLECSRCQNPLQYWSAAAGHTSLGKHPSPFPTVLYLPLERK